MGNPVKLYRDESFYIIYIYIFTISTTLLSTYFLFNAVLTMGFLKLKSSFEVSEVHLAFAPQKLHQA